MKKYNINEVEFIKVTNIFHKIDDEIKKGKFVHLEKDWERFIRIFNLTLEVLNIWKKVLYQVNKDLELELKNLKKELKDKNSSNKVN